MALSRPRRGWILIFVVGLAMLAIGWYIVNDDTSQPSRRPAATGGRVAVIREMQQRLEQGRKLARERKWDAAIAAFEGVAETEPGSSYAVEARIQIANVYRDRGQHEKAIAQYEAIVTACALPREAARARRELAGLYERKGEPDRAMEEHRAILDTYRDLPEPRGRSLLAMSRLHEREGRLAEARNCLGRLLRDYSAHDYVWASEAEEAAKALDRRRGGAKCWLPSLRTVDPVEGRIDDSSTWRATDGPFLVSGVFEIARGVCLTIEPGVTVAFALGARLDVAGGLRAEGTEDAPIIFRSALSQPSMFDWQGIAFGESAEDSLLRHCRVRHAVTGIETQTAALRIEHCKISKTGTCGITVAGCGPALASTCVTDGGGHGLVCKDDASPTIGGCTIGSNAGVGLICQARSSPKVTNCRISDNGGQGLSCQLGSNPELRGCLVSGNKGGGVLAADGAAPRLAGNAITGNAGYAVENRSSTSIDAKGNWWGTVDQSQVSEVLRDKHDAPSAGQVIFLPFLESAPSLTVPEPDDVSDR